MKPISQPLSKTEAYLVKNVPLAPHPVGLDPITKMKFWVQERALQRLLASYDHFYSLTCATELIYDTHNLASILAPFNLVVYLLNSRP